MTYTPLSLNGTWNMCYSQEKYTSEKLPEFSGETIKNSVPGYWEDMDFTKNSFSKMIKYNPEYCIQRYPISNRVPDMALPNIIGTFFYSRKFYTEEVSEHTCLHFEGVQNSVSAWINGKFIGRHEGYCTPFEFILPKGILNSGENSIVLCVSNHRLEGYCGEPVIGLTSRAALECTGGITGDIDIRFYVSSLKNVSVMISDDLKKASLQIVSLDNEKHYFSVCDGNEVLKSGECYLSAEFDTSDLEFWSPENPKLYTLKVSNKDSELTHKFGVRRLTVNGTKLNLNGKPYFLRGVCEHCYFPETVHPNHDKEYYTNMIKTFKKLGFNFIRFHTYIPEKEYLESADELGMLVHIESPNNTTVQEWTQIVNFCKKYTSPVIYCCGNELMIDEPFINYLNDCANIVHQNTDALFSPLSALRGIEYHFPEPDRKQYLAQKPFEHDPQRFDKVSKFSDMYSSYANGQLSYFSLNANPKELDSWGEVYKKPRVSHEICIDGTYTDLSIKDRYKDSRIGKTEMFSSIEEHLRDKGVLDKAPLYFKNSSEWQRRIRKYCFEAARRCSDLSGFDFLGPIDTHWHTFGYDVGMMNEFYELKPGENIQNVLMYNSPSVILTDLEKKVNFSSNEELNAGIYISHYGKDNIKNATTEIKLFIEDKLYKCLKHRSESITNGTVTKLCNFQCTLPHTDIPQKMRLNITLSSNECFAQNEWELYLFPKVSTQNHENIVISSDMDILTLTNLLENGKNVLLTGKVPFNTLPTSFRISLAGRNSGNLATVIYDHPCVKRLVHDGFCSWQFSSMLEDGNAVCFDDKEIPFDPIIEVVSSHKYVILQTALFEFRVLNGKLMVCTLNFDSEDPMSQWFKEELCCYMSGNEFNPIHRITKEKLIDMTKSVDSLQVEGNKNFAFNANDKTATRRKNKKQ